MKSEIEIEAKRIADDIVSLVERVGGPVTLCRVHREIAGFASSGPPHREVFREQDGRRLVLWSDLSEAGAQALNQVLYGFRVAVEHVDASPYLEEGGVLANDDWQPVVLLP